MKKNPSAKKAILKDSRYKALLSDIRDYFFSQLIHRLPEKFKKYESNIIKNLSINLVEKTSPNEEIQIPLQEYSLGKKTVLLHYHKKDFWLRSGKPPKCEGFVGSPIGLENYIITFAILDETHKIKNDESLNRAIEHMDGIINHEFIHLAQYIENHKMASGRYVEDKKRESEDVINLEVEHKAYLENILTFVHRAINIIRSKDLSELDSEYFNYFVSDVNSTMDQYGFDSQMKKLLWKDIIVYLQKVKFSPETIKKLKKSGFKFI